MRASAAVFSALAMISTEAATAKDFPECQPESSPLECYESGIAQVGAAIGEFRAEAAKLRDDNDVLRKQVQGLEAKVTTLNEQMKAISIRTGYIVIDAPETRNLVDVSKCDEKDPGNKRGNLHGRAKFEPPFSSIPTVMVALNDLDIGGDFIRLRVEVSSIDVSGFDYKFYTWCSTSVAGAAANWVAIAK